MKISKNKSISNYFYGSGKSENEFNNVNKIRNLMKSNKSAHSIGIGLIESSQVFEARAKDAEKLINFLVLGKQLDSNFPPGCDQLKGFKQQTT